MDTRQDQFQRLLREAQDDPQIVGLVLTGSRGKGFGSEASDFDVLLDALGHQAGCGDVFDE